MNIPPQQAADALSEIERAERHSAAMYGYRRASPHLLLWGAIWIAGYGISFFRPNGWLVWVVLVPVGIVASFLLNRRTTKELPGGFGWRYGVTAFAIFLFITAALAVLPPTGAAQVGAFIALLVSIAYVMLGVWRTGTRIAVLGAALGALTIAGYFALPLYFPAWMAGVGGGALILGGVWLRRV